MLKPIPGKPFFKASHLGVIWVSRDGLRPLSTKVDCEGYAYVRISTGAGSVKEPVHKLVAMSWFKEWHPKYEVHHIDGDKLNNRVSNLKLLTPSEHRAIHNGVYNPDKIAFEKQEILNDLCKKGFRELCSSTGKKHLRGRLYGLAVALSSLNSAFESRGIDHG